LIISTENHQALADCRKTLRQSRLVNKRRRTANFELHAQCRNLYFNAYQLQQARADLETDLYKKHGQYAVTHQVLQHSERSRTLLKRRVGEQWQILINLADILHKLRLKIDGDKLSENKKKVDITALFVDKKKLTSQIGSLKHLLAEIKNALRTKIDRNKKIYTNNIKLVKTRNQTIMDLKRNLICLKQRQRKYKTHKV